MTKHNKLKLLFIISILALSAWPEPSHALPQARIEITLPNACLRPLWIELARSYDERKIGLMFRKTVKPFDGMLFDFEREHEIYMWMKNTLIPLDMVFFDTSKQIIHIHRGAVPHSLEMLGAPTPSRYVLELPAGMADTYRLKVGERFQFME